MHFIQIFLCISYPHRNFKRAWGQFLTRRHLVPNMIDNGKTTFRLCLSVLCVLNGTHLSLTSRSDVRRHSDSDMYMCLSKERFIAFKKVRKDIIVHNTLHRNTNNYSTWTSAKAIACALRVLSDPPDLVATVVVLITYNKKKDCSRILLNYDNWLMITTIGTLLNGGGSNCLNICLTIPL